MELNENTQSKIEDLIEEAIRDIGAEYKAKMAAMDKKQSTDLKKHKDALARRKVGVKGVKDPTQSTPGNFRQSGSTITPTPRKQRSY